VEKGSVHGDIMKLNVLHILNKLAFAGTEKQVITLFNNIDLDSFNMFLFCFNKTDISANSVIPDSIRYFEYQRREGIDYEIVKRIVRIVQDNSIDIIHSHNWGTLFYAFMAAVVTRRVHIHGEHGKEHFSETSQGNWKRLLLKKSSARISDFFITVSENLKEELIQEWGVRQNKITVIRNGIDSLLFKPDLSAGEQIRKELYIGANDIVVGTVGWLRPIKNQSAIIRILPELLKKKENLKVVIVGDGEDRHKLEKLAQEHNVSSNIIFTGHREDVESLLNAFDIYIQASLFEGMSNTIMQAMSVGIPVVAMNVGGNSELVKDGITGYLVKPESSIVLIERILYLSNNRDICKEMGKNGRDIITRDFSINMMIRSNEDVYRRFSKR